MNLETEELVSVEREVIGEIMKTDVFVKILGSKTKIQKLNQDIDTAFRYFRDFAARFSRFSDTSELTQFNRSQGGQVSPELFALLQVCQKYYHATGGIFDPSILPTLDALGYSGSLLPQKNSRTSRRDFSSLTLDPMTGTATKPADLYIDLGGVGKGFVVDQVATFLREAGYADFVIDAGGDIYAAGVNQEEHYPYWAFDIEDPRQPKASVATILLSNEAVATSGRNRRQWKTRQGTEHHLIDPRTGRSAGKSLLTVSVIAQTTTEADIFAKTLFILGKEAGLKQAMALGLPALFIDQQGHASTSPAWERKAWKEPALEL